MGEEPAFKIEEWEGDHLIRFVAGADNLFVARAAFKEAVARYPRSTITLRQRCRMLEEHRPSASER